MLTRRNGTRPGPCSEPKVKCDILVIGQSVRRRTKSTRKAFTHIATTIAPPQNFFNAA